MMKNVLLLLMFLLPACKLTHVTVIPPWVPYDESELLAENADHQSPKMRSDIADFNMADTLVRIPYSQTIFDEMVAQIKQFFK